jgi:hypothetical protein
MLAGAKLPKSSNYGLVYLRVPKNQCTEIQQTLYRQAIYCQVANFHVFNDNGTSVIIIILLKYIGNYMYHAY